jgi:anti-anti-sigma factor
MSTVTPITKLSESCGVLVRDWPGVVVVRPIGQLDLDAAAQFERMLREFLGQASTLLIDASDIDFIDCAGLRVFLLARRARPDLALMRPSASVRRVLELLELDFPVLADAPASLPSPAPGPPARARRVRSVRAAA